MEEALRIIQNIGFPIFVATWLLVKIAPVLSNLNSTLEKLFDWLKKHDDISE